VRGVEAKNWFGYFAVDVDVDDEEGNFLSIEPELPSPSGTFIFKSGALPPRLSGERCDWSPVFGRVLAFYIKGEEDECGSLFWYGVWLVQVDGRME